MTQQDLDDIKRHGYRVVHQCDFDRLVDAAQTLVDTQDHVVIAKAEYDWLVDRSHRLEGLEL
jgi:hypothetical protein